MIMKKLLFSTSLFLATTASFSQWTEIITDASGDSGGIDATLLEYQYDATEDVVTFRVSATNVASYSASPSADFNFSLPAGLESGAATGTHWSSPTAVHKTAYVYCDLDGTAPEDYTYDDWGQTIEETSTGTALCTDCVDIYVDVAANQISYTFNRTDIISDTEMDGETSVEIGLVANLGHNIGWDDAITHSSGSASSASFTITLADGGDDASISAGNEIENIQIYPNPSTEKIRFTLTDQSDEVVIMDLLGNEIVRLNAIEGLNIIDVSGLPAGFYILSIYNETVLVGKSKITKS